MVVSPELKGASSSIWFDELRKRLPSEVMPTPRLPMGTNWADKTA
jgi:hypothetical protein